MSAKRIQPQDHRHRDQGTMSAAHAIHIRLMEEAKALAASMRLKNCGPVTPTAKPSGRKW